MTLLSKIPLRKGSIVVVAGRPGMDSDILIFSAIQHLRTRKICYFSPKKGEDLNIDMLKMLSEKLGLTVIVELTLEYSFLEQKEPFYRIPFLSEFYGVQQELLKSANVVALIHWPEYYGVYNDTITQRDICGLVQLIIVKNTHGSRRKHWVRYAKCHRLFLIEEDSLT